MWKTPKNRPYSVLPISPCVSTCSFEKLLTFADYVYHWFATGCHGHPLTAARLLDVGEVVQGHTPHAAVAAIHLGLWWKHGSNCPVDLLILFFGDQDLFGNIYSCFHYQMNKYVAVFWKWHQLVSDWEVAHTGKPATWCWGFDSQPEQRKLLESRWVVSSSQPHEGNNIIPGEKKQ